MKKVTAVSLFATILLLSGCLASMRATNMANNLNSQAARQGSPYRWYVVDLEGDKATLEQRLVGDVASSWATDPKMQRILSKLKELETKRGCTTRLQPKEVRILPSTSL